jgi:hypothetical protein
LSDDKGFKSRLAAKFAAALDAILDQAGESGLPLPPPTAPQSAVVTCRHMIVTPPTHGILAAVFLQLASGHALIGAHLVRIKKKESDVCWWCDSGKKQTRGHLFGGCKAWKRECLALKKRVERITGKRRKRGQRRRERGARVKVVDLFKNEKLTGAVLDFLKDTDIGKRWE